MKITEGLQNIILAIQEFHGIVIIFLFYYYGNIYDLI